MEASGGNSDSYRGVSSTTSSHSRRHGMNLTASSILRLPLSTLLEYTGVIRTRSIQSESDALLNTGPSVGYRDHMRLRLEDTAVSPADNVGSGAGEVSIRIIGAGEHEHDRVGNVLPSSPTVGQLSGQNEAFVQPILNSSSAVSVSSSLESQLDLRDDREAGGGVLLSVNASGNPEAAEGVEGNDRDSSSYQRYDIQQAARWIEQVLPFTLLLLVVFVRQHLQDTLVRQAGMIFKCFLLLHYKNSRGRNYRRQGQMLTLVEYLLLLYRALLPAPVWYRFFLNKDYGSLFSSLMTGLYLTFKLTSIVEKVQSFFTALKALSCKDIHYGAYATSEQVNAAGDLCAICQENMHAPILLCCKHIFCEDCVSEWFERERTCPLCRALVKPVDLRSFGDKSTSLFFQLF
ncbi:uncharacterized protein LOC111374773 isoform X2 [Olea europaea var. sylvestris]|uniref:uncharacterized protein LOC111374773 isoform X2 n=1 Tax=Olea europaea var. sylvestris TaxID=158386 RepID=UPI000C1CF5B4|nr:uncharacterized protein LOC111374773 isoform X2 [Olea europaea var. sylvestris]